MNIVLNVFIILWASVFSINKNVTNYREHVMSILPTSYV